ncbi:MAG: hypothetical protein U0269_04960 [Polyangiales bacterium]
MTSARGTPSWSRATLTFVGSTLLVALMIGAAIARLKRVARPTFEPVAQIEGTGATLGRVSLVRAGERGGAVLGWSVLCAGREVAVFPGVARPTVTVVRRADGASAIVARRGEVERTIERASCP